MIQPDMRKIKKMTNIYPLPGYKMFKDSDGDGVKNVFDCKPYDKNKQAWYHRAGKWVAKKTLYPEHAEKARAYISRKEKESEEIGKIRREERYKQRLETAKLREEERGRRQREFIKQGGYKSAFRKSFVSAAKAIEKGTRPRTTSKGKKRKMIDISSIKIPGL